jgi:hypothetical protein
MGNDVLEMQENDEQLINLKVKIDNLGCSFERVERLCKLLVQVKFFSSRV